ncbi:MAG: DUF423 domain-containing protein [Vicinamibacteria bacterium]|jgi:uncharacterized membrane protein YgdD (TMEM256/DUF423 family)|nr:DUF423 domain-containing protein [Vicinamibacteria bacterium]
MNWIVVGAVSGFAAVACGAFGAHGLKARVSEQALAWWNTGAHYQLAHALALVAVGLLRLHVGRGDGAGWAFLAGSVIFSGTLYAMALGAPRWFGAITPIGGVLLLAGWALLAWGARELGR